MFDIYIGNVFLMEMHRKIKQAFRGILKIILSEYIAWTIITIIALTLNSLKSLFGG